MFRRDDRVIDRDGDMATVREMRDAFRARVQYDNPDIGDMTLDVGYFTLIAPAGLTEFAEYERRALEFAVYDRTYGVAYNGLALAAEAGEVAGKLSKLIRDTPGDNFAEAAAREGAALRREMGDVLWHLTALARDLGTDLATIAKENLEKLEGRSERGTIRGEGDDR